MSSRRCEPWRVSVAVAVVTCCVWTAPADAHADDEPLSVSIIQLIATPERYEGKRVSVEGIAHFEFEESALYLHREDADCMNSSNGVWLDAPARPDLNDTFVVVVGRFTACSHGHLGAWPGEIQDVRHLEKAGTRRDYQRVPKPPRLPDRKDD
jgi:hypothetical protein